MSGLLDKHDARTMAHSSPRTEPLRRRARPTASQQLVRVDGLRFRRVEGTFRVQGVTYGPFAPDKDGIQFPSAQRVRDDFRQMGNAGINTVRVYQPPPHWLLETAEEHELSIFVDIPWSKHLCFLNSQQRQREAREAIRSAISAGQSFPSILAYSIGNEIPADIVRWHGARRIERFLRELADLAKQTDPQRLITYSNFPPTEYLDLTFADFVTFNVYLHDREVFRRYLRRLQNLVGDKPLVLGELGMDTARHGELCQAQFLEGHLTEVLASGLAGAFVFAWTDDWYTGGHQIGEWSFGITDAGRHPKAGYHAAREVFDQSPTRLLSSHPKVSVVVCSYNGSRTLDQCLRSLAKLDYPIYEVIVVDDGSTDETSEILARFPAVRSIRQSNQGLSAARNVGLHQATGSIVAYTDSDCFVDPDWLTLLVDQLQRTGAAAVGGPNLTPDDGWLACCVAASPGQPTHVLENDQVAEHIPGCNMAFRHEALVAINGFDSQYRKAGDDVDICWRLQQAGYWITFAPGAYVWHHRRQTIGAYLRQQLGYGEAEAMLRFQHPDRFNGRGDGKWNGVMYGAALQGIRLERPIIYHGTFGTGMFQCIYQPRPAHWAMLPSTLEWHIALAGCLVLIPVVPQVAIVAVILWCLAVLVAAMQAVQARLPKQYDGLASRLTVMGLCYLQPLVRSWARQWTRMFAYYRPSAARRETTPRVIGPPLLGTRTAAYWSENGLGRQDLLDRLVAELNEQRWSKTIDTGWERWDLEVFCHPCAVARIATVQEEHGEGKRLIRIGFQAHASGYVNAACLLGVVLTVLGILTINAPAAVVGVLILLLGTIGFWRGTRHAASLASHVNSLAASIGWVACSKQEPSPLRARPAERPVSPNAPSEVEENLGSPLSKAVVD